MSLMWYFICNTHSTHECMIIIILKKGQFSSKITDLHRERIKKNWQQEWQAYDSTFIQNVHFFFIHIYKIPATHTINTKNSVFCECLRAYRKCFRLLKSQNVKLNMKKKWLQRRKYFRKKSETHIHTYAYQRLEKNGRNYTFLSVMHKKKT